MGCWVEKGLFLRGWGRRIKKKTMHCIRLRCGFPQLVVWSFGYLNTRTRRKSPRSAGETNHNSSTRITSFNPNTFPCIFSRLSNVTFLVVLGELPVKKNKIQVGVLRDILMNYVLRNLVNIIYFFVYQMIINTTKVPRC